MKQPTIEERIIYFLGIYPGISPSMLQTALGNIKPHEWKPILERMIEEKKILRGYMAHLTPYGRNFTHCHLSIRYIG